MEMTSPISHPSWEWCQCCARETPHLDHECVYDGCPTKALEAQYMARFRAWRRGPGVEYRPYDDRYVRLTTRSGL